MPVDLLRLRSASVSALVAAMAEVAEAGDAGTLDGLSELAVDEVVRLVRAGLGPELSDAGLSVAEFVGSLDGRAAAELAPTSYDRVAGLLPILTAAVSPSSKGGDAMVMRSWSGKAEEVLGTLVARDGVMPRARLRAELDVSESYISHLLRDLEGAGLVERASVPGQRGVDVHLTAEGRELAPERELVTVRARGAAEEYRELVLSGAAGSAAGADEGGEADIADHGGQVIDLRPFLKPADVPPPGNDELLQRLGNLDGDRAPSAQFPLSAFA